LPSDSQIRSIPARPSCYHGFTPSVTRLCKNPGPPAVHETVFSSSPPSRLVAPLYVIPSRRHRRGVFLSLGCVSDRRFVWLPDPFEREAQSGLSSAPSSSLERRIEFSRSPAYLWAFLSGNRFFNPPTPPFPFCSSSVFLLALGGLFEPLDFLSPSPHTPMANVF